MLTAYNTIMTCHNCGYTIPDSKYKCMRCGAEIKTVSTFISNQNGHDSAHNNAEEVIEISADHIVMGNDSQRGGGILEDIFGGFSFGGGLFGRMGGSIFSSFGSSLDDLFGFGGDAYEDEDEDENFTYDALGFRVPKKPVDTVVVRQIECYDSSGNPTNKQAKKSTDKKK